MPPSEMRISGLSSDVCSSDLAAVAMHAALADARIEAPLVPVYANVAAAPVSDPDAIRAHLVEQVTGRVRWRESVLAMHDAGAWLFVEFGAKVLGAMVKRTVPDVGTNSVITMDDVEADRKSTRLHSSH